MADHPEDNDPFEEDIVFDEAGLLGGKMPRARRQATAGFLPTFMLFIRTVFLCIAFLGLGLCVSASGGPLIRLEVNAGVPESTAFHVFTARSIGMLIGGALGAVLFEIYNRQFLLSVSLVWVAAAVTVLPFTVPAALWWTLGSTAVLGTGLAFLFTGGNVLCLDLWGRRQGGAALQALHFSFSLGALVVPLVMQPFFANLHPVSLPNATSPSLLTTEITTPMKVIREAVFEVADQTHRRTKRGLSDEDLMRLTQPKEKNNSELSEVIRTTTVPGTSIHPPTTSKPLKKKPVSADASKFDPDEKTPNWTKLPPHKPPPTSKTPPLLPPPSPTTQAMLSPLSEIPSLTQNSSKNASVSHNITVVSPTTADTNISTTLDTTNNTVTTTIATVSTTTTTTAVNSSNINFPPSSNLTSAATVTVPITTTAATSPTPVSIAVNTSPTTIITTATKPDTTSITTTTTPTTTNTTTTTTATPTTATTTTSTTKPTLPVTIPTTTTTKPITTTAITSNIVNHKPTTTPTTTATPTTTTIPTTTTATTPFTTSLHRIHPIPVSEDDWGEMMGLTSDVGEYEVQDLRERLPEGGAASFKPGTFSNASEYKSPFLDVAQRLGYFGVTRFHLAYISIGILVVVDALVSVVVLCHHPREARSRQEGGPMKSASPSRVMVFTVLFSAFMFVAEALQGALHHLLATGGGATGLPLAWGGDGVGPDGQAVFWGLVCLVRFLCIPATGCFGPPGRLLGAAAVFSVAGAAFLVTGASGRQDFTWGGIVFLAVGCAPVMPISLLWMAQHMRVTHRLCALMVVVASFGNTLTHSLLAEVMDSPPAHAFMMLALALASACLLAASTCALRAGRHGPNLGAPVGYQLASQHEEDSLELTPSASVVFTPSDAVSQEGGEAGQALLID